MSEKEKINEMDAAEVVAMARDRERTNDEQLAGEAACGADEAQGSAWKPLFSSERPGYWRQGMNTGTPDPRPLPNAKDPIAELLETERKRLEERKREAELKLRREAKGSLALGGLCGLGVASLLAAASTGYWIPVAVGLGICLSGAAAILLYRGWVVLHE